MIVSYTFKTKTRSCKNFKITSIMSCLQYTHVYPLLLSSSLLSTILYFILSSSSHPLYYSLSYLHSSSPLAPTHSNQSSHHSHTQPYSPPHPISPLSLKYNPLVCPFTSCSALQPSLLSLLSLYPSLFHFYLLLLHCQSTLLVLYCMSIIIATLIKFKSN